jgi:hypothetical protein
VVNFTVIDTFNYAEKRRGTHCMGGPKSRSGSRDKENPFREEFNAGVQPIAGHFPDSAILRRVLSNITHMRFFCFTAVCTVILDGTLIKIIINTSVKVKMSQIKIKKVKSSL